MSSEAGLRLTESSSVNVSKPIDTILGLLAGIESLVCSERGGILLLQGWILVHFAQVAVADEKGI